MAQRWRFPFGILEAAILLVLAGMALWIVKPLPAAREAAAAEKEAIQAIGALADALEAAGPPHRRPAVPPAGWTPAPAAGTWGRGAYWMTVLLPARDGWLAAPGGESAGEAGRGFCVVAWPKTGAPEVLRSLAALPKGVMWQRVEGVAESGEPGTPPVPRAAFPPPGPDSKVPAPPPDWTGSRKRK